MQKRSFFLAVSFPKKAFVFPNNRISEAHICRQCWLKKISRKRKTKQQKKLRDNVFLLSPRSHAKIELIWTGKKNFGLNSHLRACCTQPFNLYSPLSTKLSLIMSRSIVARYLWHVFFFKWLVQHILPVSHPEFPYTQKQRKIKIEPRINLNHNNYYNNLQKNCTNGTNTLYKLP